VLNAAGSRRGQKGLIKPCEFFGPQFRAQVAIGGRELGVAEEVADEHGIRLCGRSGCRLHDGVHGAGLVVDPPPRSPAYSDGVARKDRSAGSNGCRGRSRQAL